MKIVVATITYLSLYSFCHGAGLQRHHSHAAGNEYFADKQFNRAISSYRDALTFVEDPTIRSKIWTNIGLCHHAKLDRDAAINAFKNAVSQDDSNKKASDWVKEFQELGVPGLTYVPRFMTKKEEATILRILEKGTWSEDSNSTVFSEFETLHDEEMEAFAKVLSPILKRARTYQALPDESSFAISPVKYLPGGQKEAHIDQESIGSFVFCLTLGGMADVTFTHPTGNDQTLKVAPRSFYRMSDEARYEWSHTIKNGDNRRYAVLVTPYMPGGMRTRLDVELEQFVEIEIDVSRSRLESLTGNKLSNEQYLRLLMGMQRELGGQILCNGQPGRL